MLQTLLKSDHKSEKFGHPHYLSKGLFMPRKLHCAPNRYIPGLCVCVYVCVISVPTLNVRL